MIDTTELYSMNELHFQHEQQMMIHTHYTASVTRFHCSHHPNIYHSSQKIGLLHATVSVALHEGQWKWYQTVESKHNKIKINWFESV